MKYFFIFYHFSRLRCYMYRKTSNIRHTLVGNKIWRSFRCSWSIACRRCSNYIFILDLTSGFNGFGKDSRKTVRESFKCWDLVRLDGSLNPSSWKTRTHLSYIVNIIAADVLATQGARASAAMILTYRSSLWNIPGSAQKGLNISDEYSRTPL